nr:phage tail family protein [Paenibacillus oenotherae]
MRGYYESYPLSFSLDGDGAISKVSWIAEQPEDTGINVQTSVSYNGGYDWSEWEFCTQHGAIPAMKPSAPLGNALLRYRVFLDSANPLNRPVFSGITFELEPVIVFENKGDSYCQPEIWVTKNGSGDFALINVSQGNEQFKFVNLNHNETVYVNSEREYIESSLSATYRYSNFNDHYLNLPVGEHVFRVSGHAQIQFRYQFRLI